MEKIEVLSLQQYRIKHAEYLEKVIKSYGKVEVEIEILNRYLFYLEICGLKHKELIQFGNDFINDLINKDDDFEELIQNAYRCFYILNEIMQRYGFNNFPNKGGDIEAYRGGKFLKLKFLGFNLREPQVLVETEDKKTISVYISDLCY